MAHVKILANPTTYVQVIYMVDSAVGPNSPNRRDDVFLVQFLLNALWGKSPDKAQKIGGVGPAPAVDGVCGPKTIAAIKEFQKWYWHQPATGGFMDGRVEPLPPDGRSTGQKHGHPYTIIGLNVNYGVEFGMARHTHIGKEPGFPIELKQKLFIAN